MAKFNIWITRSCNVLGRKVYVWQNSILMKYCSFASRIIATQFLAIWCFWPYCEFLIYISMCLFSLFFFYTRWILSVSPGLCVAPSSSCDPIISYQFQTLNFSSYKISSDVPVCSDTSLKLYDADSEGIKLQTTHFKWLLNLFPKFNMTYLAYIWELWKVNINNTHIGLWHWEKHTCN